MPHEERAGYQDIQLHSMLWELYAKETHLESLTILEAKWGWYDKVGFPLPCVTIAYLSGLGKVPELIWMDLEWIFLMICQVRWNYQT